MAKNTKEAIDPALLVPRPDGPALSMKPAPGRRVDRGIDTGRSGKTSVREWLEGWTVRGDLSLHAATSSSCEDRAGTAPVRNVESHCIRKKPRKMAPRSNQQVQSSIIQGKVHPQRRANCRVRVRSSGKPDRSRAA
jgi:hypothetical protein